jgi:hypothetical protein
MSWRRLMRRPQAGAWAHAPQRHSITSSTSAVTYTYQSAHRSGFQVALRDMIWQCDDMIGAGKAPDAAQAAGPP